jgi:hypothetical protein
VDLEKSRDSESKYWWTERKVGILRAKTGDMRFRQKDEKGEVDIQNGEGGGEKVDLD